MEQDTFLLSACKVWLLVQRDGGKCSLPKWTRNHLVLHQHPEMNWKCCASGDPSDSPRRIKVDVFSAWSPPNGFTVPSANWEYEFFTSFGQYHVFCIESFTMDSWCVHLFQPSRPATRMSPFQILPVYNTKPRKIPGSTFFPNWWIRDWSFVEIGWYSTKEPNGRIGPLNGSPQRLSVSSRQTSDPEYFAASSNIPWNPPIFIQTWLQQYRTHPFLNFAYCSLSNPICFRSVWRQRTLIPWWVFTGFTKFQGSCQCKWHLVS